MKYTLIIFIVFLFFVKNNLIYCNTDSIYVKSYDLIINSKEYKDFLNFYEVETISNKLFPCVSESIISFSRVMFLDTLINERFPNSSKAEKKDLINTIYKNDLKLESAKIDSNFLNSFNMLQKHIKNYDKNIIIFFSFPYLNSISGIIIKLDDNNYDCNNFNINSYSGKQLEFYFEFIEDKIWKAYFIISDT